MNNNITMTNYFESEIERDFGITGKEAIARGIIQNGTKLNGYTGNIINDGWECIATGNNYPTQYEAVKAHFKRQSDLKPEQDKVWNESDVHWTVHCYANGDRLHTLHDAVTGKLLIESKSRMRIENYKDLHPELKFAKRCIKA